MTDDHDALLAAVLADPAADLPRLLYADWLDDRGEPALGEFIRVQCELAQLVICGNPVGYCGCRACTSLRPLRSRERQLWAAGVQDAFRDALDTPLLHPALGDSVSLIDVIPVAGVRRGFVGEVRCPLAAWVGGICRRCRGYGNQSGVSSEGGRDYYGPTCPVCPGTGRTPGVGPALVRRHPVERVELTDREPMAAGTGRAVWWDTFAGPVPGREHLTADLWRHLPGATEVIERQYAAYPTPAAARDALSAAALAWAKSAG